MPEPKLRCSAPSMSWENMMAEGRRLVIDAAVLEEALASLGVD